MLRVVDLPVDRRLALSEFIRIAGQRFIALRPGEEEAAFDDAIVGLAEVLSLTVAARWDVARNGPQPVRRLRWVREGVDLEPPPCSTLNRHNPFVELATSATEPVVVDDMDALAANGLLSESELAKRLTRLLVPGRSDASVDCVLALSRPLTEPWLDWEIEMLAEFAQLIPLVRARVDTEHRIAASFDRAPFGMTLRTRDFELIECNRAFCDFLGYASPAELVGRRWMDLVAIDVAGTVASLNVPPEDGHRQVDVPFRHSGGATVWARLAETKITSQHGDRWLSYVEDVTELRRRQEIVARRANKDALTGLANRHELLDVLGEQLNTPPDLTGRSACAVVMLDLNDFKLVNDTHGHAAGDAVLVTIGQRLRNMVRSSDLVARYGGDEYIVVLAGPIGADDAVRVATKLATAATEPIRHDGTDLEVGVAVGVALGRSGDAAATIIANADSQMYDAKREGPSSTPALVAAMQRP